MNLKGLLPQDVDFITGWFEGLAAVYNLNLAEMFLVRHSVARILCNEYRDQGRRKVGEGWWDPMPNTIRLSHIIDWLVADLQAGAPWLANVDEQGRPRKLLKCKTFEDLEREANKAMDRRNGQQAKALGPDDESFIADLGDGYSLVQMITPEALDLESARMHHCVGHGAYDGALKSGWSRFLSLRDRKRRPVATIELRRESNGRWSIRQIEGKRNERPPRKVMEVIRSHATKGNWRDRHCWWPVAEAPDDVYYDLDRIPEAATVEYLEINDYELSIYPDLALPAGLTVLGDADISPSVRLPEGMTVNRVLTFTRRSEGDPKIVLPESLHAEEIRVGLAADLARPIPAHLVHRIRFRVEKMSGYSWSAMEWVDELHPIDDDESEPGPGM
jgi:hypothetical protein